MKFIKKILLIIILLFVIFIVYLIYKNILYRLYPWKIYDERNCIKKVCHISEINQKFTYWKYMAVKKNNFKLCNNANKFEKGSVILSGQEAVNSCKLNAALESGDVKNCYLLSGRYKGTCFFIFPPLKKLEK